MLSANAEAARQEQSAPQKFRETER
jgi:hypothetical protein